MGMGMIMIWVSLLRTVLIFSLILVSLRVMGKRQISQLQTSELVVTLLISELAVTPIEQPDTPLWQGLAPIGVLVLFEIVMSFLMLKSGKFRQWVCGKPIVVMENGKINQNNMRRLRMTTEDLWEQLRQNGAFYFEEVNHAVVETNGLLSVQKKPECDFLTPKEAGVKVKPQELEVVVISDGEISAHSLLLCGKDTVWLNRQLQQAGLSLQKVFIMTASSTGKPRIIPKDKDS